MRDLWLTSRGAALHCALYESEPGAPAVVFVHGLGGSAAFFSSLVPGADFLSALADEGLTVFALDLRGHGLSEGRRGHAPFELAIADIHEAVGFARERTGGPVALAGSGIGGTLALYAAIGDDRVTAVASHTAIDLRSITLFEPRARWRVLAWLMGRTARRAQHVAPLVRLPLRALFPPRDFFEDRDNVKRWLRLARAPHWYTLDTFVSTFLTPDAKPAIEALTKPLLVVTGEHDRVVPLAGQEDLVARIGDAELSVIAGAGHMIPLEHLSETAARMGGWLRKVL